MGFKRKLCCLILVLMPLFLFTGCGDLEPEMQDTRTVILNMDFQKRSSSRSSSSVSASELSQYNTHLILALPSWEYFTSNYKNFYSSFAQGLMNTADKKVSLEIPLNTQMKIFAFLFKENYSMSELILGTHTVGYYGKSQTFSIATQTNNLSLGITLQSTGTTTGDGGGTDPDTDTGGEDTDNDGEDTDTGSYDGNDGGTDNTAPTASVNAATITTSGNAVVQSTETGTAYLVKTTVSVSNNLTSITGAADSQWNSVTISLANTDTNLPATGLADGTYKVFAVDAAGNLSSASSNSVTVATTTTTTMDPSLEAFYPFNGNAYDLTSNGRDFTVYGDTTLTDGKDNSSNSAYYFDGDGDYLETANIPSFDNYTISLWAKPASSGTYEAMFSSYNDSGYGFQIDLNGSNFHIRKSSGSNIVLSTAQLDAWTFIAFTYDGINSIAYINNETPVSDSGGTTEFNRFRIGRNRNGSTFFSGAIDELRIYNRALTASEISSLYTN